MRFNAILHIVVFSLIFSFFIILTKIVKFHSFLVDLIDAILHKKREKKKGIIKIKNPKLLINNDLG